MNQTTILAAILIAATAFAAGYLLGHDRLDIHDCQKFLELERFDTIAKHLQGKTYFAPQF